MLPTQVPVPVLMVCKTPHKVKCYCSFSPDSRRCRTKRHNEDYLAFPRVSSTDPCDIPDEDMETKHT